MRTRLTTVIALVVVVSGFVTLPHALAAGGLSWSAPAAVDPHDPAAAQYLNAVACPSTTQCTAVDEGGREVTFNPNSAADATAVTIDGAYELRGVACPSVSACVAVDDSGHEITFDPASPGSATTSTIESNAELEGVACPSDTQCTAIDFQGHELTFDPTAPGTPTPVTALQYGFQLDCPTAHECVAIGLNNDGNSVVAAEVTFDPTSPGTPTPYYIADSSFSGGALSCPSATQCTEVGSGSGGGSYEATFDPEAPQSTVPFQIDRTSGDGGVACASTQQCTAAGFSGEVVTFDPTAPTAPPPARVARNLNAIACPSASQCTAVGLGDEATFDPTSVGPAMLQVGDGEEGLYAVQCPASNECVGAGTSEHAVIFNPLSPGTTTGGFLVGSTGNSEGLSCPSTTVCAVVSQLGLTVFDPTNPGSPSPVSIDNHLLEAIACPSVTQCTVVDQVGAEVTFDPSAPNGSNKATIDSGNQLNGVACPSTSRCVAVDDFGNEVTFDPTAVGSPTPVAINGTTSVVTVACPSATQCTALGVPGKEITFNPASPGTPNAVPLSPVAPDKLNGIDCVSTTACLAVDTSSDNAGDAIAFNPSTGDVASAPTYLSTFPLLAMACPSATQCTAVDGVGNEITYDPTAPPAFAVAVDDPGWLVAVSCAAATQCTAVDQDGQESTFNPASPGQASVARGASKGEPVGLSCPTLHVCVEADLMGNVSVFDPASPADVSVTNLVFGALRGIVCPSATQCTAIDPASHAITFNPNSPATATTIQLPGGISTAISCPAVTRCVAVGGTKAVVFNPQKSTAPASHQLGSHSLTGVACPTVTSCVAVDTSGYALLFDPAGTLSDFGATAEFVGTNEASDGLACASPELCVAVGGHVAVSGNPKTARWKVGSIAGAGILTAVACAGTNCSAVDEDGHVTSAITPGPLPSCTLSAGKLKPPATKRAPGTVKLRVDCVGDSGVKITGSLTRRVGGKRQNFRVTPSHGSAKAGVPVSFTAKLTAKAFAPGKHLKLTGQFTLAATNGAGTTTLTVTTSR